MLVPAASCSKKELSLRARSPDLVHSKRLRAVAVWTTGGYQVAVCTTPLLAVTNTEPASRLHAEVVTEYLLFLRDNPLQTKRIERAWQLLLRRFEKSPKKRRWFQVTGFTSHVTAILLELEWKPVSASHWIGSTILKTHGPWIYQTLSILSPSSMTLSERPCDTCGEQLRYIGMERVLQLQHQISRCCAVIFTVSAREVCFQRAAMLQLAACGGLRLERRRHEAFLQDHANCPRCDIAELETEEHRFYFCEGKRHGRPRPC